VVQRLQSRQTEECNTARQESKTEKLCHVVLTHIFSHLHLHVLLLKFLHRSCCLLRVNHFIHRLHRLNGTPACHSITSVTAVSTSHHLYMPDALYTVTTMTTKHGLQTPESQSNNTNKHSKVTFLYYKNFYTKLCK